MSPELRQKTIEVLKQTHLYTPVRWTVKRGETAFWTSYEMATGRTEKALMDYTANNNVPKLHIGCGGNYLDGWFNTDLNPNQRRTRLNATRRFPYPDNTFSFIFTEHMIEHVPYAAGRRMLKECHRVLKPGGVLRLVTPDLKFLIGLYQNPQEKINQDYVKWAGELFLLNKAPHTPVSVMNNFFRDWGHQYIYDVPTMREALKASGFNEIKEVKLGESEHAALRGLEHQQRMPDGFLALESMVIEARKT